MVVFSAILVDVSLLLCVKSVVVLLVLWKYRCL